MFKSGNVKTKTIYYLIFLFIINLNIITIIHPNNNKNPKNKIFPVLSHTLPKKKTQAYQHDSFNIKQGSTTEKKKTDGQAISCVYSIYSIDAN